MVVEGELRVALDGADRVLRPGDAVVLPAGITRRLTNAGGGTVVTLSAAQPGATASAEGADPVPVPWAR